MDVELTWDEVMMAATIGLKRHVRGLLRRRQNMFGDRGADYSGWDAHIIGALGEYAVAKGLNRFWPGADPGLDYEGDVGRGVHVRATERRNGCLIIHETDPPELFILVTGTPPVLTLAGFEHAGNLKDPRWFRTDVPRPGYFVPQDALTPMTELVWP